MSAPPRLAAERASGETGISSYGDRLREEPGPGAARCLGLYAKLAAGVTVVTARGEEGPLGMTVSAVTSLSARPPLLLGCLREGSRTLAAVRARGVFAVHLLREDQHDLAGRFAHPTITAAQRFAGTVTRQVLGVPVIDGALAWSVCLVEDLRRYGDHHLVVGRVAAVHVGGGRPLLWHDRRFGRLTAAASDPGPMIGPAPAPLSGVGPSPGPGSAPAPAVELAPLSASVRPPVPVPAPVPVAELDPAPVHASAPAPAPATAPDGPG